MNLTDHIYKEGDKYYFDTENYTDQTSLKLSVDYEDGDRIIWKMDGKKFSGVLHEMGTNNNLFIIEKVTEIK